MARYTHYTPYHRRYIREELTKEEEYAVQDLLMKVWDVDAAIDKVKYSISKVPETQENCEYVLKMIDAVKTLYKDSKELMRRFDDYQKTLYDN